MLKNRNPIFYLRFDKDTGKLTYRDGDTRRSFDCVDGWLKEIRKERWVPKGGDDQKPRYSLALILVDRVNSEEYHVSTSYYGGPARGILNQLASIDPPIYDDIMISSGKKNEFTTVYMQQGGKRLSWKYPVDDIPKTEKYKIATGEEVTSNLKKDAFFEEIFEELCNKINLNTPAKVENPHYAEDPNAEQSDGDIPF